MPTDLSDCSAAAIEHASTFAVMYNAHLHILHVAKEAPLPSINAASSGTDNVPALRRQRHEDELSRFVAL